jgi:hypothetical protein
MLFLPCLYVVVVALATGAVFSSLQFLPPFSSVLPAADWYGDILFWFHIGGVGLCTAATFTLIMKALARRQFLLRSFALCTLLLLVQVVIVVLYVQRWRADRAHYLQFYELPLTISTSENSAGHDSSDRLTTLLLKAHPSVQRPPEVSDQTVAFTKALTPSLKLLSFYLPEQELEACRISISRENFYCAEFLLQGERILFLYAELFRGASSWDNYANQVALRRMTSIARLYQEGGVIFVLATDVSVLSRQYGRIAQQAIVGGTLSPQELVRTTLSEEKLLVFSRRPHIPPDVCEIPDPQT